MPRRIFVLFVSTVAVFAHRCCTQAAKNVMQKYGGQLIDVKMKVAITACMRKMLTILNAMIRDQQPFRYSVIA